MTIHVLGLLYISHSFPAFSLHFLSFCFQTFDNFWKYEKQSIIKHVLFAHRNTVFNDSGCSFRRKKPTSVSTFWNTQFKPRKTIWKNNQIYHEVPTFASSSGWSVNKSLLAVPLSEMALWNKPFARGDKIYNRARTSMTSILF